MVMIVSGSLRAARGCRTLAARSVELLFSVEPASARVPLSRVEGGGDLVEVAGADLGLVLDGGVAGGSSANSASCSST